MDVINREKLLRFALDCVDQPMTIDRFFSDLLNYRVVSTVDEDGYFVITFGLKYHGRRSFFEDLKAEGVECGKGIYVKLISKTRTNYQLDVSIGEPLFGKLASRGLKNLGKSFTPSELSPLLCDSGIPEGFLRERLLERGISGDFDGENYTVSLKKEPNNRYSFDVSINPF